MVTASTLSICTQRYVKCTSKLTRVHGEQVSRKLRIVWRLWIFCETFFRCSSKFKTFRNDLTISFCDGFSKQNSQTNLGLWYSKHTRNNILTIHLLYVFAVWFYTWKEQYTVALDIWTISKHRTAKSCVSLDYLKIGRIRVKPNWKHWIFTSNDRCLHTGVPYNTAYVCNRPLVKAKWSLFTYKTLYRFNSKKANLI